MRKINPFRARAMSSSVHRTGSTYAESTKTQIVREVLSRPGRTGGQFAASLGLDRSRVNSFLYGEGKNRFGLLNSNWRWYPARNFLERPSRPSTKSESIPFTDSVCGILSKMSLTNATLKIRSMPLTLLELAFTEDEYPLLDERLQVELVMRKKSLELMPKDVQVVKQAPNGLVWVVIIILGIWVLTLLSNQKSADDKSQPLQRVEGDNALPRNQ